MTCLTYTTYSDGRCRESGVYLFQLMDDMYMSIEDNETRKHLQGQLSHVIEQLKDHGHFDMCKKWWALVAERRFPLVQILLIFCS